MTKTVLLVLTFFTLFTTLVNFNNHDKDKSENEVSIIAVGDNLIHNSVLKSGIMPDSTYNFDRLFDVLREDFQGADLAVINQETILGGDVKPYDGYPNFNSPNELGDAIVKAGFDVVLHASNHTLDVGVQGVINCIEYWKTQKGITCLGINENQEEKEKIKLVERNGIKIALLNYTYGLNGHVLPKDKSYLVNLIDTATIIKDIREAELIADFTIVFPHWGVEYVYTPNNSQKKLAKIMTENGADLIIGTHPHVIQDVEWIICDNGNRSLCYYSLGNYISGQKATPRILGGMAEVKIRKTADDVIIEEAELTPIITHYEWINGTSLHQTYKLEDYTTTLEKRHSLQYYDSTFSLNAVRELSDKLVDKSLMD